MDPAKRPVVWAQSAIDSLDSSASFVAQENPMAASELIDQVLAKAQKLSTLFDRGRRVPELRDPNVRELIIGRYRLMYEVHADAVTIVVFVPGASDFRG